MTTECFRTRPGNARSVATVSENVGNPATRRHLETTNIAGCDFAIKLNVQNLGRCSHKSRVCKMSNKREFSITKIVFELLSGNAYHSTESRSVIFSVLMCDTRDTLQKIIKYVIIARTRYWIFCFSLDTGKIGKTGRSPTDHD